MFASSSHLFTSVLNQVHFSSGGGGKDKLKNVPRTSLSSPKGSGGKNVTLLARYCKEHVPRTCDHSMLANGTRFPRPCSLAESYLSTGDSLTLELKLTDSSALRLLLHVKRKRNATDVGR